MKNTAFALIILLLLQILQIKSEKLQVYKIGHVFYLNITERTNYDRKLRTRFETRYGRTYEIPCKLLYVKQIDIAEDDSSDYLYEDHDHFAPQSPTRSHSGSMALIRYHRPAIHAFACSTSESGWGRVRLSWRISLRPRGLVIRDVIFSPPNLPSFYDIKEVLSESPQFVVFGAIRNYLTIITPVALKIQSFETEVDGFWERERETYRIFKLNPDTYKHLRFRMEQLKDPAFLRHMHHPAHTLTGRAANLSHLIQMVDFLDDYPLLGFVLPRYDGNAQEYFANRKNLTCDQYMGFAKQILLGLEALHARKRIHNDLKPTSILTKDDHFVIAGFDLSCDTDRPRDCVAPLSRKYAHPSLYTPGVERSHEGDLYSFALTILDLFLDKLPFGDNDEDWQAAIAYALGTPTRPEYKNYFDHDNVMDNYHAYNWRRVMNGEFFMRCPALKEIILSCLKWDLWDIPDASDILNKYF